MIYLVRHGETEFNAERRMQGHLDSPLTALGRAQAQAVGARLRALVAETAGWRIVASPLGRAQATARIIGTALGLPIEIDHRLIEVSFGEWDGRLRDELTSQYPETLGRSDWQFAAPGGESYEAVNARIADWLSDLEAEPDRKVIAVSHGGSGRVVRGAYLGLSRDETWVQPVPQDAIFGLVSAGIERFDCHDVAQG
jgi:probable phosphoglycerate mutase